MTAISATDDRNRRVTCQRPVTDVTGHYKITLRARTRRTQLQTQRDGDRCDWFLELIETYTRTHICAAAELGVWSHVSRHAGQLIMGRGR